jgi:hypothetical protein
MRKVFLVLAAAVFVLGLNADKVFAAKKVPPKVLFDFEDDKEIKDLFKENNGNKNYPVEKTTDHATSGKFALKVQFPNDGDWPGIHFLKFDGDWSKYDYLKVDVFNPTNEVVALHFGGIDKDSGMTAEKYFGEYGLRYHADTILKPGKNTFEIELTGATVEDKSRALILSALKRFAIFVDKRPTDFILYMDNIRLEKAEDE